MDRLERLVNLVAALIDAPRPLTRDQLRARVGGYSDDDDAFRRNFERDKDTLRQMGLPLVVTPLESERQDEQVGYRIPRERYELPDPGLSEEELAALRIAASAVRVGGVEASSALRKLAASGSTGAGADVTASGSTGAGADVTASGSTGAGAAGGFGGGAAPGDALAELAGGEAVTTAFGAIAERRRVRFGYRGEPRLVDPWRLAFRGGQWYLSGLDHGRGAERLFRLDRVEGSLVAEGEADAFSAPPGGGGAPPPPWRLGDEPPTEVVVVVDAEQGAWARQSAGGEGVERPDGTVELTLEVTNRAALRSWVLGFLDHAEIVGPPEVRAEMVQWLAGAAGSRR